MNSLTHKTPKIGLALGGGGARGIAHIGVLKALQEESIPIDMIAGTSAGAVIGSCYAKERNVTILEEIALGMDWKKLFSLVDFNLLLLGKGLVHGRKVKALLSSIIGNTKFEDLEIPLAVVAADAQTTEEIVINEGSVIEAVRASISMPVIFTPVKWGNKFLVDGGIVNAVPVDVVRNMGAEVIIAVNVIPDPLQRKQAKLDKKKKMPEEMPNLRPESIRLVAAKRKLNNLVREDRDRVEILGRLSDIARTTIYKGREKIDPRTPNIIDVLMQSIHAMEYENIRLRITAADIVISPDVSRIGTFGFYKGEEAITLGYNAAKGILPQLQGLIRCL